MIYYKNFMNFYERKINSVIKVKQDPRLQGRAPGFRQGQDRDKTGTRQRQVRQGKDRDKIKEGGIMGLGKGMVRDR